MKAVVVWTSNVEQRPDATQHRRTWLFIQLQYGGSNSNADASSSRSHITMHIAMANLPQTIVISNLQLATSPRCRDFQSLTVPACLPRVFNYIPYKRMRFSTSPFSLLGNAPDLHLFFTLLDFSFQTGRMSWICPQRRGKRSRISGVESFQRSVQFLHYINSNVSCWFLTSTDTIIHLPRLFVKSWTMGSVCSPLPNCRHCSLSNPVGGADADLPCHHGGNDGTSAIANADAGSQVTFRWSYVGLIIPRHFSTWQTYFKISGLQVDKNSRS
jgi:hypothetical protein